MQNLIKSYNLEKIFDQLFPICRSITGDGYRKSLKILKNYLPFKINRYPSNKKIFDWKVPLEWNINDGYIKNSEGKKILNLKDNN